MVCAGVRIPQTEDKQTAASSPVGFIEVGSYLKEMGRILAGVVIKNADGGSFPRRVWLACRFLNQADFPRL
jgi:hypothetical protein